MGKPQAISILGKPLNKRQRSLLRHLQKANDTIIVRKDAVNMRDLSALTAICSVEFAMFTRSQERMVVRGDINYVNIDTTRAAELNADGWRWSGHTHPGTSEMALIASPNDMKILREFTKQEFSSTYDSFGRYSKFRKR